MPRVQALGHLPQGRLLPLRTRRFRVLDASFSLQDTGDHRASAQLCTSSSASVWMCTFRCPLRTRYINSTVAPQMCTDGGNCKRRVCFFAHTEGELRKPEDDPAWLQQQLQAEVVAGEAGTAAAAAAASGSSSASRAIRIEYKIICTHMLVSHTIAVHVSQPHGTAN
jgi:hypothetical protein